MNFAYERKQGEPGEWYYFIFQPHPRENPGPYDSKEWHEEICTTENEAHAKLIVDALNQSVEVEACRQWLLQTQPREDPFGKSPLTEAYRHIVAMNEIERLHDLKGLPKDG